MTAVSKFFATTELVEATLSSVQPRDLLQAQGVSRKFRAVITGSKKLQQTLYFTPTTDKPLKRIYKIFGTFPIPEPAYVTDDAAELEQEAVENPFLSMLFDMKTVEDINGELLKTTEAIIRPEASWRQMYFTSPPVPDIGYKATFVSATGDQNDTGKQIQAIRNKRGVKLGELIDAIEKVGCGNSGGHYYVDIRDKFAWKKREGKGMLENALRAASGGHMHGVMFTGPPGARQTTHFGPF